MSIPTLKQYENIRDYLENNPDSSYDGWYKQYRPVREKKQETTDSGWNEVWNEFPATANFKYKGMQFTSSRALRKNKSVCEQLYNRIIASGEVTKEQLIKAIQTQVNLMKQESFDKGDNRLQYLPAMEPYLRQGVYMGFVGLDDEEQETETNDHGWA